MKKSIIQLKNLFLEVATEHRQIKSFFWGDFLRAQKEDVVEYPLLNVFVDNASISRNQTSINLIITVADKVFKDYTNLDEVQSDALLICKDIVDVLSSDKWLAFSNPPSVAGFEPFVDDSIDELTGWVGTITLNITSVRNLCAIPFEDYDFEGNYVNNCPGVKIYEDGVFKETVESGGDFYYTTSGTCDDATAVLKDSAGTTLSTTNIASGATANITAPDGTVTITDTTPATLYTVPVKSNGTATQQISNSTVNVNKSDATLISAVSVKAEATTNYNVGDSTVNVNATQLTTVKATDTLNITVVDSLDASVTVTLSGGNKITIPSLPCTGVTPEGILYNRPTFRGDATSYRTGDAGWLYASGYYDFTGDPTNPATIAQISDFNTLTALNLFGNTYRFTDETGALADGTNQFLLDHLTGLMFVDDGVAAVVWNDAIDNALASTLGGYSDWHLVTTEEIYSSLSYATALTSYMVTTGGTGVFTSTTRPSSTTQAYIFIPTTVADNFGVTNKTNVRNSMYCRAFFWNDSF